MISSLSQMVEKVKASGRRMKIAVSWAQDSNTVGAISRAVSEGFAEAIMIGSHDEITKLCNGNKNKNNNIRIVASDDETDACSKAVKLANSGDADIIMKGLVSTDKFLKAVMDKENGIMMPNAVLSYVGALEIPAYHKLLFITDPAVIPFPDLDQKVAMAEYAIGMALKFGLVKPKVALIGATEKKSRHFSSSSDYSIMCTMAERGQIKNCIMDGPLDLFLACDRKSPEIKGVRTPVDGDADILLFPTLESCNPFYKGLMLFANGEMAGLIRGTRKPVIVMSRSESELSKYYCIAMACLMV